MSLGNDKIFMQIFNFVCALILPWNLVSVLSLVPFFKIIKYVIIYHFLWNNQKFIKPPFTLHDKIEIGFLIRMTN